MKKILLIIPMLLFLANAYGQETNEQKFKKLEWLIGKWIRTNAKQGQSGYESWTKVSDLKLSGSGVTMKGKKITFQENLEFIIKGKDIFYAAMVTGEKQPTYFKLTSLSNNSFTCENPDHDFPKKITYNKNGKNIKAVISGNGEHIDYTFKPEK